MAGKTLNPAKWSSRAGAAGSDYAAGVTSTTKDWAGITAASQPNYEAGVTAAIGRKAFASGVNKAGTAKWKNGASNIGAARYPQGVAAGQQAYSDGFSPYAAKLDGLQLPPRGPKGSPSNIQRVAAVATALNNLKTKGT
jgi:hypothetical protein